MSRVGDICRICGWGSSHLFVHRCYTCFFCGETVCVQSSGEHRRTCAGGKRRQPTLPSREDGFMCFLCGNTSLRPHHTSPCDNCGTSVCEDLTSEHLQTCPRGAIQRQVGEEHDKAQRDNNPLGGGEGGEEAMSDDDDGDDGDRGDISQPGPSGLRPPVINRLNALNSDENSPDEEDAIDTPHLINRVGALGNLFTRLEYSIPSAFATDPIGLLSNFKDYYISEIENYMNSLGGNGNFTSSLKILLEVKVTLLKQRLTEDDDFREHFITTPARLVTLEDVGNLIDSWVAYMITRLEDLLSETEGSGFILYNVDFLKIVICNASVRSVLGDYVPYPPFLRGRHEVFNPNPAGNNKTCIIQCIAAFLASQQGWKWRRIGRLVESHSRIRKMVKYDNLSFLLSWEDISKLENRNKLSIFLYSIHKHTDGVYHVSLCRRGSRQYSVIVPLLLLGESHVALIKEFDKFLRNFTRSHKRKTVFCRNCLSEYQNSSELTNHSSSCDITQKIIYPQPGDTLHFKNTGKGYAPSHVGYFDFECVLSTEDCLGSVTAIHRPIAYSYIIVDRNHTVVDKFTYFGGDSVTHFMQRVATKWEIIRSTLHHYEIDMSLEDMIHFRRQTHCQFCEQVFTPSNFKVQHHDHLREKLNYIGALCNYCNLRHKNALESLVLIAHNMSYDMGLILREFTMDSNIKSNILMRHGTKYLKVEIGKLKFLDSLAFITGSLSSLAKTHTDSASPLTFTHSMIEGLPKKSHHLLLKGKQFFPYEYTTKISCFNDTTLPPIEMFYSSLNKSGITLDEYRHSKLVWEATGCRTLKDYLLIYLRCDVGLLADIFTHHRAILNDIYSLELTHYCSLPGYSYDCFLKSSRISLDLSADVTLHNLLSQNIRGGFTTAVRSYVRANNRYVNPSFKPQEDRSSFLLYLDFNSLYGSCMTRKLPHGGLRRLSSDEMNSFISGGEDNDRTAFLF
ncbi:uncharacterized protein [Procambarus clarkii]|uniref:uncharacterized protein n=1 Tax=Procambarus clarkii TaxID=6728 RepID=UPI00374240E5